MSIERRDRLRVHCPGGDLVAYLDHEHTDDGQPVGFALGCDETDEVLWPHIDDVEALAKAVLRHVDYVRSLAGEVPHDDGA